MPAPASRLADGTDRHVSATAQAAKRELVRRSHGTLWVYTVLTAVTALCTSYPVDHPLLFGTLAAAQILVAAGRSLIVTGVRRTGWRWSTTSWAYFYVLTLIAGALWGLLAAYPILAYGLTAPAMVTVVFTAGLLAGGTSTLCLVPRLYLPWTALMIAPLAGSSFWLRSSEGAALGAAFLLCVGMLLSVARKANRTFWDGVEKSRLLESASRAKDQFLAHMSHEIRTPLTVIVGLVELLRHDQGQALSPQRLASLESATASLSRLVDDVLDLSRVEEGAMRIRDVVFDVRQAVESCLTTMSAYARSRGLALESEFSPDVPSRVCGDPGRLQQVLLNLVGNAIKFTEEGRVDLNVRVEERSPGRCLLEFAIRDTGIGIDPDRIEAIFTPFTQADQSIERKYGGTGLGLTISSRLISLMGGTIEVESEKGTGSEFRFTIDVALSDEEDVPTTPGEHERDADAIGADHAEGGPGRALSVLAAEDNPQVANLIAMFLTTSGHQVDVVENGRLAVETAGRPGARYDVILMDLEMPELNGIDAAKCIREHELPHVRATPIIALTGHATTEWDQRSREAGIDMFMSKPVNFRELIKTMHQLVGTRSRS